jgi:hypothetical protein
LNLIILSKDIIDSAFDAKINAGITTNRKSTINGLWGLSCVPVLGEKIRQSYWFSREVYSVQ